MKNNNIANLDFETQLKAKADLVDSILVELIDKQTQIPDTLRKAMNYSVLAGGKRLRGALVLWSCFVISGAENHTAQITAAAIEMVHTYSLIHDDLPAMDDDDIRRGKPSCHRAFDEATAILAGDGLLTLAFELLSTEITESLVSLRLIRTLAQAAGPSGMIAGQMADLDNMNKDAGLNTLQYIHLNKTAKMFACAAEMGAVAGGADEQQIESMQRYGMEVGLGFQIIDDILDVLGTTEHIGKTAGKDVQQGKTTYPGILGLDESKQIAQDIAERAITALEDFDNKADILRQLPAKLLDRTR